MSWKTKPHSLEQDDDGHWYILPLTSIADFRTWLDQDPEGEDFDPDLYDKFKIDGPHKLIIYDYEIDGVDF